MIVCFVVSVLTAYLSKALGFEWAANPASGALASIIFKIPFMLMGEELISLWVLETAQSKGFSFMTSTLISALIFGLLHIFTYWDGSLVSSLVHVLFLQSVARLIFNYVYLKTGRSIWGSWLTHIIFDIIVFAIGGATK